MRLLLAAALPLAALAGCGQGGNEVDPATTDLNLNSNAAEVDQALNELDQQSDLENTAGNR